MRSTLAVLSVVAVGCVGCGSHTVSSPGPSQGAASSAASAASSSAVPPTDGMMFAHSEPWTLDVSAAAKSDRSDAILQTLSDLGGWGNDNVLQIDFSIPIFTADAGSPRVKVVGTEDY